MSSPAKPDRPFDLLVVGAGSAGTSAAKVARAQGRTVAVVGCSPDPGRDYPRLYGPHARGAAS